MCVLRKEEKIFKERKKEDEEGFLSLERELI